MRPVSIARASVDEQLSAGTDSLPSSANNRLVRYAKTTTGDPEVLRRQRMLFDFDTKHPKGIAATDQEVLAAVTRRNEAVGFLRECGWPDLWLALRRDDEVPF